MPDWLLYWVFPWALINRPKPVALSPLSDEVTVQERDFIATANLAAVVLGAGNNVFVSDEVVDFVFGHDCCAISFKRVEAGIIVSVVFDIPEPKDE